MRTVFVEIDMRNDFADDPRAALPVPGTYALVGKMRVVEDLVDEVLETFDHHEADDEASQKEFEIFGPHCVPGTWGHERIAGLAPSRSMPKNTYDFWKGVGMDGAPPSWAEELVMGADLIYVGGVVTGICVNAFINGAIEKGLAPKLRVISDCVANLEGAEGVDSTEDLFNKWTGAGVTVIGFDEAIKELTEVV